MKALFAKLWSALGPWLHKVLSQDNGTPSSIRLAMVGWNLAVILVWLILCACHREMVDIKPGVLEALAIANGAKVVQKFGESDGSPQP